MTSVASRSISHSVSHSRTPSRGPTIPPLETTTSKRDTLIDKLDFDLALTTLDQGAGIRVYYQRYKAVLAAQVKFAKLQKDGEWDASFIPTQNDFITLVTSRTMWYNDYKKNFEQVERYPEMIDWLEESVDALSDIELWGFEQQQQGVYQWSHLQAFFARGGRPWEESEDGGGVKKVNTRKGHKKVKKEKKNDKGKAKAKARGRSSDEESESSIDAPCRKSGSSRKK